MGIFIDRPSYLPTIGPSYFECFQAEQIGAATYRIWDAEFWSWPANIIAPRASDYRPSEELSGPVVVTLDAGFQTPMPLPIVPSSYPSFSRVEFHTNNLTISINSELTSVQAIWSPVSVVLSNQETVHLSATMDLSTEEVPVPDFLPKGEVVGSQAIILNGSLIPTFNVARVTQKTAIVNGVTRLMPIGRTEGSSANVVMTVDDDIVVT